MKGYDKMCGQKMGSVWVRKWKDQRAVCCRLKGSHLRTWEMQCYSLNPFTNVCFLKWEYVEEICWSALRWVLCPEWSTVLEFWRFRMMVDFNDRQTMNRVSEYSRNIREGLGLVHGDQWVRSYIQFMGILEEELLQ